MNENDMKRMQQEAMRRAKEMQSRAKSDNQNTQDISANSKQEPPTQTEQKNHEIHHNSNSQKSTPEHSHHSENIVDNVFDVLMKDRDRTLILSLILILMDEKADNSLILALLYLLI
ncbi:MAG: hypothetical protein PUG48_10100 [Clostridia bacterium]|nr:hypothetical protein [Clostridia bacterium]